MEGESSQAFQRPARREQEIEADKQDSGLQENTAERAPIEVGYDCGRSVEICRLVSHTSKPYRWRDPTNYTCGLWQILPAGLH